MTERGLVQAECPTCGTVVAWASSLVCGISEEEEAALCEFPCPTCDLILLRALPPIEITTLFLLGASKSKGLPFELLEAHSGPTVSWDEILDLHVELERQLFPQRELVEGRTA